MVTTDKNASLALAPLHQPSDSEGEEVFALPVSVAQQRFLALRIDQKSDDAKDKDADKDKDTKERSKRQ